MFLEKYLIPDIYTYRYGNVTPELLSGLGVRGLICDIDNTLVPYEQAEPTPAEIKEESPHKPYGFFAVTAGEGIRTGLVSVPLTNMHTPVETLDIRDVDSVASVLAAAAKEVM